MQIPVSISVHPQSLETGEDVPSSTQSQLACLMFKTQDSFLSLTLEPWLSPNGLPFPEESRRWMIRSASPWQPERSFCTPTEGLESVPSSGGRDRKENSSDISHTSVSKLPHVFGQVTSCPCADLVLRRRWVPFCAPSSCCVLLTQGTWVKEPWATLYAWSQYMIRSKKNSPCPLPPFLSPGKP